MILSDETICLVQVYFLQLNQMKYFESFKISQFKTTFVGVHLKNLVICLILGLIKF